MPVEHIIFAEQSAWKTWATPDKALRVDSFSYDPGVAYVERRVTGNSRGLQYTWLGPKQVTGSFQLPAWYERIGWLFKHALLHDIVSTQQGATAAYEHGFLPKDDSMPNGLSVQLKRDSTQASNLLGVLITSLTFQCASGEPLVLSGDFVAYDEAPTGGTWEDGTSAPAVIASPSYIGDSILPFRFQHATLVVGGTVSFDDPTNIFSVSGGTTYNGIESIDVTIDQGLDPRVFLGDRLSYNVIGQDRGVTGRFDFDQSTVNDALYDAMRGGTENALILTFDSGVAADTGYNYELEVFLPRVVFTGAPLPDLEGANDRRMQSVDFTGLVGSDGHDIGIRLVNTDTSY